MAKTKGCLRGPPPWASVWDDTTIESQIRPSKAEDNDNCNDDVANNLGLEDSPAKTTTRSSNESSPPKFSNVEQQQPQQRDEGTTEVTVTATTKHWIERAARHAKRQRQRRSLAPRGESFVSAAAAAPIRVRVRPREGHHQRALLASLEQERAAKRASLPPPHTVKWHVVRDTSFVAYLALCSWLWEIYFHKNTSRHVTCSPSALMVIQLLQAFSLRLAKFILRKQN